jgi:hypothetical protein
MSIPYEGEGTTGPGLTGISTSAGAPAILSSSCGSGMFYLRNSQSLCSEGETSRRVVLFGLLQRLFGPPARVQLSELFERLLQFFVAQSPLIAGAPRKTVQFSSKLRHREKRMKIPLLVTLVGLAISFTSCSPTSGYNGRIQGASGPGSVGTNPSQRGIYPGNPNGAGRGFFFALGNGQSIAP